MEHRHRKASLLVHEKLALNSGLIREVRIWKIPRSERYPEGIKYRLVLVNPKTTEVFVLYDNHWPKGPHLHLFEKEKSYRFVNIEKLIKDFLKESETEEKRFYENKKN